MRTQCNCSGHPEYLLEYFLQRQSIALCRTLKQQKQHTFTVIQFLLKKENKTGDYRGPDRATGVYGFFATSLCDTQSRPKTSTLQGPERWKQMVMEMLKNFSKLVNYESLPRKSYFVYYLGQTPNHFFFFFFLIKKKAKQQKLGRVNSPV